MDLIPTSVPAADAPPSPAAPTAVAALFQLHLAVIHLLQVFGGRSRELFTPRLDLT